MSCELKKLLGTRPHDNVLSDHVRNIASITSNPGADTPFIKSYSDCVYFNYFRLGLSFIFLPKNGYKPRQGLQRHELEDSNLVLDSIDIYNLEEIKPKSGNGEIDARTTEISFSTYPVSEFTLSLPTQEDSSRPTPLTVTRESNGKYFVSCLGEPDRKGGGSGPSTGSIGIWCQWSKDGIMVEFGGADAIGPKAWETGMHALWKVITIFPPKTL
jgi:hypothetical protein